ncbi:MAG: ABC transporter permease subunit, partial [Phycisphaeraceae bacterium]|nr:ABC transporter permease subunit [Phycisphaeraceae bacterium]
GLAYLSQIGTGYGGLAGFGKTAASLVNLTLLIVPLMAVTMGALSLSSERERGMLAYMLAQPVTRTEVFLSKFIGQGIAFAGTIAIGFGSSAALLSRQGAADGEIFLRLAGLSLLLALAMLATGMLIATVVRRASAAMGTAVFVWLFVTLFGDLGVMGASSVLRLEVDQMLALTLANPTQLFKLASIAGFDATLDLLGPAGLYAVRTYGDWLTTFLVSLLVVWVLVPLGIGSFIFSRRPL